MNRLQEKPTNRPARSQQPLARHNKLQNPKSKPKPSKGKETKPLHNYPTRLNAKSRHKQPQPQAQPQQPEQKPPNCEHTKSTEETEQSESPPHPTQKSNPELQDLKSEILQYVSQREELVAFDASYLRSHKSLTPKMRSYLVRHFFKICLRFQLNRNTLHLAVHYTDLFFSRRQHVKDQLEVVSLAQTCLFIAMKYEEIYPPELTSWVDYRHIPTIIRLEAEVLHVLDFQLAHYTLEHYKDLVLWESGQSGQKEPEQASQLLLLVDLTLFDLTIRQFKAAQLARCIHQLTRGQQRDDPKMALNVKWMVQRNQEAVGWLMQQKYCGVVPTHLS